MSATKALNEAARTRFEQPGRPAVFGFSVLLAFAAAFVGWGIYAPVAGAAVATGNLQVETQRQAVQHPYGGVVKALAVHEGSLVAKGQTLLTLDDTAPRSQLDVLTVERDSLRAQEARLSAERDEQPRPSFPSDLLARSNEPNVVQALANERAVMTARTRQHEAEISARQRKVAQLNEQIAGSEAEFQGLEKQRDLLEEEANGVRTLFAQGFAPKTRVLALERTAAQLQADSGARRADAARSREAIGQTELEIAQSERTRVTEITTSLQGVQSRLAELAPKIEAAQDVLARTRITAPATGAVVGLTAFTVGGVIQPGGHVLDVVPTDNPLLVEARLNLIDVSEVTPGKRADVQLTGFTRNERPKISGEVTTVSADRMTDERTGQGYYSVRVRLNPNDVHKAGVELQAGMPAEVVIPTRSRTLIAYLISPLTDEISKAFREK